MADQRTPRSATPEDTVAIPVIKDERASRSGNGRVLPPPPPDAAAPKPASRTSAKPAIKRPGRRTSTRSAETASPAPAAKQARNPSRTAGKGSGTTTPKTPAAGTPVPRSVASTGKRPAAEATTKPTPKPSPKKAAGTTRKARLRLTRIDPWSVMKTAFLLSIAVGIVLVVATFMVWSVLDAADVWASINQTVEQLVTDNTFDIEDYLGTRRVVGFAMIVAAVDVVLITAIATLSAFLYNMSASLLGGIEVTLAEDR